MLVVVAAAVAVAAGVGDILDGIELYRLLAPTLQIQVCAYVSVCLRLSVFVCVCV